jgi:hypothetical protein
MYNSGSFSAHVVFRAHPIVQNFHCNTNRVKVFFAAMHESVVVLLCRSSDAGNEEASARACGRRSRLSVYLRAPSTLNNRERLLRK